MTPDGPQLDEHRRRQRGRAVALGLALGAFVLLLYFISIAKMTVGT